MSRSESRASTRTSASPEEQRGSRPTSACRPRVSKLARHPSGRGGRVAEGTRLLSEYGDQTPSRVRIPPSPFSLGVRLLFEARARARGAGGICFVCGDRRGTWSACSRERAAACCYGTRDQSGGRGPASGSDAAVVGRASAPARRGDGASLRAAGRCAFTAFIRLIVPGLSPGVLGLSAPRAGTGSHRVLHRRLGRHLRPAPRVPRPR